MQHVYTIIISDLSSVLLNDMKLETTFECMSNMFRSLFLIKESLANQMVDITQWQPWKGECPRQSQNNIYTFK